MNATVQLCISLTLLQPVLMTVQSVPQIYFYHEALNAKMVGYI